MNMTAQTRKALSDRLGVDEQYLYQCLSGRKSMRADEAVRIERASAGELRRWHLRTMDWWKIWPELIGADGAPAVPVEEVRDAA